MSRHVRMRQCATSKKDQEEQAHEDELAVGKPAHAFIKASSIVVGVD